MNRLMVIVNSHSSKEKHKKLKSRNQTPVRLIGSYKKKKKDMVKPFAISTLAFTISCIWTAIYISAKQPKALRIVTNLFFVCILFSVLCSAAAPLRSHFSLCETGHAPAASPTVSPSVDAAMKVCCWDCANSQLGFKRQRASPLFSLMHRLIEQSTHTHLNTHTVADARQRCN